jgi:hypothetical protein
MLELLFGGGFQNIQELHVKKYKEAMKGPGKDNWGEAVFEEHDKVAKSQSLESNT